MAALEFPGVRVGSLSGLPSVRLDWSRRPEGGEELEEDDRRRAAPRGDRAAFGAPFIASGSVGRSGLGHRFSGSDGRRA